jgi:Skp family chaperone for outer membrane proteins
MSPIPVAMLLALSLPSVTLAQQPQPAAPGLGGQPVAGVCLLSQAAVIANAKVGLAATARLKQLTEQVQGQVDAQRTALATDAKALEAQRATLKPADYQQKQQALGQRFQALQQIAQGRSRQIDVTRQQVLGQIATAAQPVIASVYTARHCGLLVDRNSVLGGNMANDLTGAVVQGLDAKITTISFDLALPPAQTAGPAH